MADLTKREKEILDLIGIGLSGKVIAKRLGISQFTVRKHRANMASKLGCHSAAALVSYAVSSAERRRRWSARVLSALRAREVEIVGLIALGMTSKHIARRLGISPLTVRKHRENAMTKLDVHSIGELIVKVFASK